MRSYDATRGVFSLGEMAAWLVLVLGLVAGISTLMFSNSAPVAASLPGFFAAGFAFLMIIFLQIGRATVDTAEYSQQILKVARDQLEVSRQGPRGKAKQPVMSRTDRKALIKGTKVTRSKTPKWSNVKSKDGDKFLTYGEHEIKMVGKQFFFEGEFFDSKEQIEERVLVQSAYANPPP